jgi:hypothetical protein
MGYMVSRLVNDRSISSTASLSCLLPKEIALAERMIYRLDFFGSTERSKKIRSLKKSLKLTYQIPVHRDLLVLIPNPSMVN